jgi:hypothetical protein
VLPIEQHSAASTEKFCSTAGRFLARLGLTSPRDIPTIDT